MTLVACFDISRRAMGKSTALRIIILIFQMACEVEKPECLLKYGGIFFDDLLSTFRYPNRNG